MSAMQPPSMIRKAFLSDAEDIRALVNHFASSGSVLPLSLHDTYDRLRDFLVYEGGEALVGCGALHISWKGLAELRSLVVREENQGRGIGRRIVEHSLEDASILGIEKVFVLPRIPEFFRRLGFADCPREYLPRKIWTDCVECPRFPDCDAQALIRDLKA